MPRFVYSLLCGGLSHHLLSPYDIDAMLGGSIEFSALQVVDACILQGVCRALYACVYGAVIGSVSDFFDGEGHIYHAVAFGVIITITGGLLEEEGNLAIGL